MESIVLNIGDNVVKFKISLFEEEMDVDKILKIDYLNLVAEILTFPVIVNKLGILAADMDNLVSQSKLSLKIYEAKKRKVIRKNAEGKMTIQELEDEMVKDKIYQQKYDSYLEAIKQKEYVYSIYFSAKDKSKKLDKLSLSLRLEDFDESSIQKQLNRVYFNVKKGRIN